MIFIVVKFPVREDRSAEWLDLVVDFTTATRAEEGNLFFEWSRSVDSPHTFVLVEGFASPEAGQAHVGSEHFRTAMGWIPSVLASTPEIINVEAEQQGWGAMGELAPSSD